jgi:hypothetical protein
MKEQPMSETIDNNAPGPEGEPQERLIPPATFLTLVTELAIQVMMNLGEIPNPVTGEPRADLEHAKHTIDLMGVLQEKTRGNLNEEEERALNQYLYDLRMKYVRAVGGTG